MDSKLEEPSERTRPRATTSVVAALAIATACGPGEREVTAAMEHAVARSTESDTTAWANDVREFYATREMRPAWTSGRGLNARGKRIVALLDSSTDVGLDPSSYGAAEIRRLQSAIEEAQTDSAVAQLLAELDAQVTVGYRRYVEHLDRGTIEYDRVAPDRPLRPVVSHVSALDATARGDEAADIAKSLEPSSPQYDRLRDALRQYDEIARNGGWPSVTETTDSGSLAATLRDRLAAGADARERELALEGRDQPETFDTSLVAAVRHFQLRHGLQADGALGPATIRELNVPVENRMATLAVNLDRWRALPRESSSLLVRVNIPAFRLTLLEDGQPVLEMKVVVGEVDNQTPVMVDTMETVVTNPYWNVPESILAAEIVPAMAENGGYLSEHDMEIVSRSDPDVMLDPGDVDWDEVVADTVGWLVRQRPGPRNALGKVKFLFPNPLHIYLHDTPTESAFDRHVRALSHGCVRLDRPLALARAIFSRRTDLTDADLDELLAMQEERHIALDEGIPVHLIYMTAWVDDEIGVQFLADIYERDAVGP